MMNSMEDLFAFLRKYRVNLYTICIMMYLVAFDIRYTSYKYHGLQIDVKMEILKVSLFLLLIITPYLFKALAGGWDAKKSGKTES